MIQSASSSKVVLVAGRRSVAATDGAAVLRRFRLARLRQDGRPASAAARAAAGSRA